jgi:acyl carrier protein
MTNQEIVTQVNQLMHQGFEIPMEKLTPSATLFEELGLDSLDAVDMLVHLEEKLSIKIDGERLMNVRTMQDIYALASELAPLAQPKSELTH